MASLSLWQPPLTSTDEETNETRVIRTPKRKLVDNLGNDEGTFAWKTKCMVRGDPLDTWELSNTQAKRRTNQTNSPCTPRQSSGNYSASRLCEPFIPASCKELSSILGSISDSAIQLCDSTRASRAKIKTIPKKANNNEEERGRKTWRRGRCNNASTTRATYTTVHEEPTSVKNFYSLDNCVQQVERRWWIDDDDWDLEKIFFTAVERKLQTFQGVRSANDHFRRPSVSWLLRCEMSGISAPQQKNIVPGTSDD